MEKKISQAYEKVLSFLWRIQRNLSVQVKKQQRLFLTLLFISAGFLFAGSCIFYFRTVSGISGLKCIGMSLQNVAETLLFNPILTIEDILAEPGFMESLSFGESVLMFCYRLTAVLIPIGEIIVVFHVVNSMLHVFTGLITVEDSVLLIGYNDLVSEILDNPTARKLYLWSDSTLPEDTIKELRRKGISVDLSGFHLGGREENQEEQNRLANDFLRKKKISSILIMTESDTRNIMYYMALHDLHVCREKTIHFCVLNNRFETREALQNYFDEALKARINHQRGDTHMDLRIFSIPQINAERTFRELPLFTGMEKEEECHDVHLLIVGGGRFGEYVLLHAMNQGVLTSENKIIIDVIDRDPHYLRDRLNTRFDQTYVCRKEKAESTEYCYCIPSGNADGSFIARLHKADIYEEDFQKKAKDLNKDNKFTYIAFCLPDAETNFDAFLRLNGCIGETNRDLPISLRIPYSEQMKDFIGTFPLAGKDRISLIGDHTRYVSIDDILNTSEERTIRIYHSIYESIAEPSRKNDLESIDQLWNKQVYYRRQANRALYFHKDVKDVFFHGKDSKENQRFKLVINERLSENSGREINEIRSECLISTKENEPVFPILLEQAKAEHRRFCYFYASEGWTFGPDKKEKDRIHNCLCTWADLCSNQETKKALAYDLISSPPFYGGG